jgi:Zn-dependent M28 family amino/carboxypeptidase
MSGGSDFYSFLEVGIPSGGLATGAGELKDEGQRHKFGGFADAPLDPCYHKKCDTLENVDQSVLEVMSKNLGFILETLAFKENIRDWLQS